MAQFNENVELINATGVTVSLKNTGADIIAGGNGTAGNIRLYSNNGVNTDAAQATVDLNGSTGDIAAGGQNISGKLNLKGNTNTSRMTLDAATGDITAGGNGVSGDLILKSADNKIRVRLLGDANLWMGGNGAEADIVLFRTGGDNVTLGQASVHLDGESGDIFLGGSGVNGDITLRSDKGDNRVRLWGDANLWMGGHGADGDIVLFKSTGDNATLESASIHLDGGNGNIRCNDVIIPGADFAEDFDIDYAIADTVEPGTVMVLGRDGRLHESSEAFDRKVAGVVSGAGKYRVGITLDKQPGASHRMPIALSGKVMVKVDASFGAIEIGDLITTSPRRGHAMKASDPSRSFGAVIGKALADFPEGDGLLPILVALQ